ncbi:hypothetical protein AB4Y44_42320 [Paraburkholderia sp. BR10937]|uniref:hypothetical protein n=1 Tax=Paraburkholderia sp. BR10937 TaxID=3236994 RepID=UPI0034D2D186
MTPDDYVGRSQAIRKEIERCRDLLDDAARAYAEKGVLSSVDLLARVHRDLDDALRRLKDLDDEFVGGNS